MSNFGIAILVFVVSMVVSTLVYPGVLRFAKSHDIMDNPNARKLQRMPVPVMGGLVVYVGILCGGLVLQAFMNEPLVQWGLTGMSIMLVLGMWDDMKSLSASFHFLLELVLVSVFMWQTGIYIDDFHGLWGIHALEPWVAIPQSVVVGVGLINMMNLIDGVDGYSSGYGMIACVCFALLFWSVWSPVMVSMAMIVAGALLPFFMHNVFGIRSKMFIGDGGTLMLGMLMNAVRVLQLVVEESLCDAGGRRGGADRLGFGHCVYPLVRHDACDVHAYFPREFSVQARQDAHAPSVHRHGFLAPGGCGFDPDAESGGGAGMARVVAAGCLHRCADVCGTGAECAGDVCLLQADESPAEWRCHRR